MEAFSFVHAADLHLGYSQYGLETRRRDFDQAFQELVDKTIDLEPDFMIIAGDIFHHARPSNITLEDAIRTFSRLREVKIPVLTVDGSHDSAPNMLTGTVLNPLDSAELIYHLPRHEGACWRKKGCCYIYGIPNFRTRRKTEESLPAFMEQNKPKPDPKLFNIFVFHMALDLPKVIPPYMEAEVPPELIPAGFNYYAAGHIHKFLQEEFKSGILVYSGSTETVGYEEAKVGKGFYHVQVDEKGRASPQLIKLESARKFVVLEQDFTGVPPSEITLLTVELVKGADEAGAIVVPVLRGVLPVEASRAEVDMAQIRNAAKQALLVRPVVSLRESEVSEEIVRSIFEAEFKDLKTKAFEYFLQIFLERYPDVEAEKISRLAVDLIEPLTKKEEERVKQALEGVIESDSK
ncbi:hypothetical protein GTO27_08920 [Candidatus Bathyarchaeota archaeon]|nr:hypothetical protein [Candidatus Bathyarchaeota archaeon]